MVAKNDITGDAIQTKGVSKDYRSNYDMIFRKKDRREVEDALAEDEAFLSINKKESKDGSTS